MTARVLVVDADPDLRETVADLLAGAGYQVETAENGAIALDLLARSTELPDLILLDMMMPVMDGWDFSEEKRKVSELADIPVIVFSAHADIAEAARAVHAVASLRKPLRLKTLLDAIASHLPRPIPSGGLGMVPVVH